MLKGLTHQKLAPGAELTVQGADRSRVLKGLTHHKLAPGADLTVQGADRSRVLKGLTRHKLAPVAELTIHGDDDSIHFSYHSDILALPEQANFLEILLQRPGWGWNPGRRDFSRASQPIGLFERVEGDHCHIS